MAVPLSKGSERKKIQNFIFGRVACVCVCVCVRARARARVCVLSNWNFFFFHGLPSLPLSFVGVHFTLADKLFPVCISDGRGGAVQTDANTSRCQGKVNIFTSCVSGQSLTTPHLQPQNSSTYQTAHVHLLTVLKVRYHFQLARNLE
jgi:hypothetical protein